MQIKYMICVKYLNNSLLFIEDTIINAVIIFSMLTTITPVSGIPLTKYVKVTINEFGEYSFADDLVDMSC